MDKTQLEVLLTTLDHWTVFFTALVVLGVGGELVVHVLYSRVSSRLIALQRTEERRLQEEISTLTATTAEANKVAAQANERAKQMELRTEELKSGNLEIQRKIADRFLTQAQRRVLLEGLQPHRTHRIIITRLGDREAGAYGDSIIKVFEQAGWLVERHDVGMYLPPTYGMVCRISMNPDPGVKDVLDTFAKANIDLTIQRVAAAPSDTWVDLLVALKPAT
jgi:hypothetical protein